MGDQTAGRQVILVADQHVAVLSFMAEALTLHGYHVIRAINGTEAIRAAAEWKGEIHLLIAEVSMPGMSGPQLSERLLIRPEMRVLFISAYPEFTKRGRSLPEPAEGFLQKPFNARQLLAAIRQILPLPRAAGGMTTSV